MRHTLKCIYCIGMRKPHSIEELVRDYKKQGVPVDHALLHLMELFAAKEQRERVELEAQHSAEQDVDIHSRGEGGKL